MVTAVYDDRGQLPCLVFTMEAAEGKLFQPLAYTKTFALIGSIVVASDGGPVLWRIGCSPGRHSARWSNTYTLADHRTGRIDGGAFSAHMRFRGGWG